MPFDLKDVQKAAAKLDPQRKNPGDDCVYTDRDGHHCVAGEILSMLGVPLPAYFDLENEQRILGLSDEWEPLIGALTQPALLALDTAQSSADQGNTWGTALEKAGLL